MNFPSHFFFILAPKGFSQSFFFLCSCVETNTISLSTPRVLSKLRGCQMMSTNSRLPDVLAICLLMFFANLITNSINSCKLNSNFCEFIQAFSLNGVIDLTQDDLESMLDEIYGSGYPEIGIPLLSDEIRNVLNGDKGSKFAEMWKSLNRENSTYLDEFGKLIIE